MSTRSIWKGPFIDPKLLHKVNNMIAKKKNIPIKTWSRKSTILPHFVGLKFSIHNGKNFISVFINDRMVGKRLGEFIFTRKFVRHSQNK